MHIALVCSEYPPAVHGGLGSFTHDLARGLVGIGHQVTVAGVYQPYLLEVPALRDEIDDGVRVVRIPPSPAWLPGRARVLLDRRRLSRWLKADHRRHPYDIIEAPEWGGELLLGGPPTVPAVCRMHGGHLFLSRELHHRGSRLVKLMEKRWLRRSDALVSVSDYLGRRTLQLAGIEQRSYEVIHNAVDTTRLTPAEGCAEPGLIVFANTIRPNKGVLELALSMCNLSKTHPQARLVCIGGNTVRAPGGELYSEQVLAQLTPEARSRVRFTGRWSRQAVIEFLQRAHVCCYPSHMEGLGIAPIEAMALAKPTVFSRTGPGPEVIEHGVSGLLCDPHDPDDIARQIATLLDDSELAARLGRAARQRVLERFDHRGWIERNAAYYESVVSTWSMSR